MTGGLAHVCLVTSHMTVTRARIEMNIPRKRAGSSDHQKAIFRFYEAVYQVLRSSFSFSISVNSSIGTACNVSVSCTMYYHGLYGLYVCATDLAWR